MGSKHGARRTRQQLEQARQKRSSLVYGFFIVVLIIGLVGFIALMRQGDPVRDPSTRHTAEPVRTGRAAALGVRSDTREIRLGRVPLDVTVEPTWRLTNVGPEQVLLGKPHAEVQDGCCPGPLLLDSRRLAPGASTSLRFPLMMHAGMDGPHDFVIHVPIKRGSMAELMTLRTTADFSD